MSAPFLGALSWIMLLGRNGIVTKFFLNVFHIKLGSIYGFKGILLVQALKYFPLVFICPTETTRLSRGIPRP